MTRVKRGVVVKKRHKKLLKLAKGYKLGRKNIFRLAKQAIIKAKGYSYRDRKVKKRDFRSLWIIRINAALKIYDLGYKDFIYGLKLAKIDLNRKMLAILAVEQPEEFEKIVNQVKTALKK